MLNDRVHVCEVVKVVGGDYCKVKGCQVVGCISECESKTGMKVRLRRQSSFQEPGRGTATPEAGTVHCSFVSTRVGTQHPGTSWTTEEMGVSKNEWHYCRPQIILFQGHPQGGPLVETYSQMNLHLACAGSADGAAYCNADDQRDRAKLRTALRRGLSRVLRPSQ